MVFSDHTHLLLWEYELLNMLSVSNVYFETIVFIFKILGLQESRCPYIAFLNHNANCIQEGSGILVQ